jgi:CubicO group peptidase (beta-lactamase class C family)
MVIAGRISRAWPSQLGPAFALLACSAVLTPAGICTAEEAASNLLFASQAQRRVAFAAIAERSPTRRVRASGQPYPLPTAARQLPAVAYEVDGEVFTLPAFLAMPETIGFIVVQDGAVLLEHYGQGHDRDTPWISFSVTKSVTSMLLGAAIADGYIESVTEPVAHYLPRLRGTAYEGVSIEQVLHMASGVAWNEDYSDPNSDVARAGAANGLALVRYLARLPRVHPPGEVFNYNTGETNLAGEILRAAIGNNASTYLEHKIWRPFGMEHAATWLLGAPGGGETGGCCLSATLRDYARIGLFALADGVLADGTRVLPPGWLRASTRPSPGADDYGYQWWLLGDGVFAALGIFGQRIVIDPELRLVVAMQSNAPSAVGSTYHAHLGAVTAAIRQVLSAPGASP